MRITAIAGGVGGARFVRGLLAHLHSSPDADRRSTEVTVIGNTGDDITLFGLRVCPDLDTVMYTLGGGIDDAQGWGREGETHTVQGELAAYGAQPQWFGLGDRDFATHIARSQLLGLGMPLSQVTEVLCARWGLPEQGVRLLPMTDQSVETHVVIEDDEGRRAIHFQEWWVRHQAAIAAQQIVAVGMERAVAGPGVLEAIRDADVVLLPPSNPVVSIGIVLGVPGVRDAVRGTRAPVVGVSPLIGGRPVRGHADACLAAIGVDTTALAVAGLYEDFLDGWLVDTADAEAAWPARLAVRSRPLLMSDVDAAAAIAGAALDLAVELQGDRASA
ncbi:2-phospho-L-lactate transferase [Angustibacter luteus]|uniref:2-phospho-L-lactate transferase n=1 Tax=Angustibacter luteus TaxID=658456 RepID=A0ABW1JHI9_9ACTN